MDQQTVDAIIATIANSDNVIAFPVPRREPQHQPLWAACGLYDPEMMADYWRDMGELAEQMA